MKRLLLAISIVIFALVFAGVAFAGPTITLSRSAGSPNSLVRVSGTGWTRVEDVAIRFDELWVTHAVTESSGAFSGASFRVPADALPGGHVVAAFGYGSGQSPLVHFLVRTNWSMFRRGSFHTGFNPFENQLSPQTVTGLEEDWVSPTGFEIVDSSPAVWNGSIFIGALDDYVYSFDAETGARRWRTATGSFVISSPAVADGRVFVGSEDNRLYALDANSGDVLWTRQADNVVDSSPVVDEGRVYFTSQDGYLYALVARTGALAWKTWIGAFTVSSPAAAEGVVYVGSDNGHIWAIDAKTGAVLWKRSVAEVRSSPIVLGERVFVTTRAAKLVAFNRTTGRRLFAVTLPGEDGSSPAGFGNRLFVSVYTPASVHKLLALRADTGAVVWTTRIGPVNSFSAFSSSPAVANGVVYLGSSNGTLYAFNTTTGAVLWRAWTHAPIHSSPAVADGRVYVGSENANVYSYALP